MNLSTQQLLELKEKAEKATHGNRYVINDNGGIEPCYRPLWCVRNDAYDSCDEMEQPFEAAINYGTKHDADFINAANPSVISQLVDRLIEAERVIEFYTDNDSKEYFNSKHGELARKYFVKWRGK